MLEIAGLAVTGIALFNDLLKTYRDLAAWGEADLLVDRKWLPLAISKAVIPEGNYVWSKERHVPTRTLKGTHSVLLAYNKEKGINYQIVQGPMDVGLFLTRIKVADRD